MNSIMDENQLTIVKDLQYDNPNINEIDYILDNVIKDCRDKYFHTFEYKLVYDLKFTNISQSRRSQFLNYSQGYGI